MKTKAGEIIIKLYEDNSIFIDLPEDEFLQIVMFAYYLDRIAHNLPKDKYYTFIEGMYNTSYDFVNPILSGKWRNLKLEDMIKKVAFRTLKFCKDKGKGEFEAQGEYFKKSGDYFYMNTHFKPIFASSDFLERRALDSLLGYFDYLVLHLPKLRIIFLMFLVNTMTGKYIEKANEGIVPPLSEVPKMGLNATTDFIEQVTKKIK
ncbi:MAG: hypothetical protein Q7R49_02495 [Candidatus Daviesbacteria bacterium]|nr:hypothetical protein [Candidatus Daviesbacteria bacterium]